MEQKIGGMETIRYIDGSSKFNSW